MKLSKFVFLSIIIILMGSSLQADISEIETKIKEVEGNKTTYSGIVGAAAVIDKCIQFVNINVKGCWTGYNTASGKNLANGYAAQEEVNKSKTNIVSPTTDTHVAAQESVTLLKASLLSCENQISPIVPEKCKEVCNIAEMQQVVSESTPTNPDENIITQGENAVGELTSLKEFCTRQGLGVISKFKGDIYPIESIAASTAATLKDVNAGGGEGQGDPPAAAAATAPDQPGSTPEEKKGWFTADNLKKVGIGAALGGGAMYLLNSKKNKDKDKEKKEAEANKAAQEQVTPDQKEKDFQNGFAYDANGKKVNCQSAETYLTPECKPVLLNFCGKTTNANNASCNAFVGNYCATATASQAFCLTQAVSTYCAQTGPLISQNPSCQWLGARPANCAREPETSACLLGSGWTAAKLSEECPKYPYDPLCKAHDEGKKVLQLDGDASAVADLNSSGGGLSSLINTTDQASSSTSSVNLFGAGSAALSDLCARGQLVNCSN